MKNLMLLVVFVVSIITLGCGSNLPVFGTGDVHIPGVIDGDVDLEVDGDEESVEVDEVVDGDTVENETEVEAEIEVDEDVDGDNEGNESEVEVDEVEYDSSCDDSNPCTEDSHANDGSCVHRDLVNIPCEDDNLCTINTICLYGGICGSVDEEYIDCDDNNRCTADYCDQDTGCINESYAEGHECGQDLFCHDVECLPCEYGKHRDDGGNIYYQDYDCDGTWDKCHHNEPFVYNDDGTTTQIWEEDEGCDFESEVCVTNVIRPDNKVISQHAGNCDGENFYCSFQFYDESGNHIASFWNGDCDQVQTNDTCMIYGESDLDFTHVDCCSWEILDHYDVPYCGPQWSQYGGDSRHSGGSNSTISENQTLELNWSVDLNGSNYNSTAIGSSGTVYSTVTSSAGSVYLVAYSSEGDELWRYTGRGRRLNTPVIAKDGTIHLTSNLSEEVHAINPDGTVKWIANMGGVYEGGVGEGMTIDSRGNLYIASLDGGIYALDREGNERWYYSVEGDSNFVITLSEPPVLSPNGENLYVLANHVLHSVNTVDGSQEWTIETIDLQREVVVDADGFIYIFEPDDRARPCSFKKLDPVDGSLVNEVETPPVGIMNASGNVWNGRAYVSSYNDQTCYVVRNMIRCESDDYGQWAEWIELPWTTQYTITSKPVIDENGWVYIGAEDRILAFNAQGEFKWDVVVGVNFYNPIALADDGSIYVVDQNNNLNKIGNGD